MMHVRTMQPVGSPTSASMSGMNWLPPSGFSPPASTSTPPRIRNACQDGMAKGGWSGTVLQLAGGALALQDPRRRAGGCALPSDTLRGRHANSQLQKLSSP
jgi:hypothetical protein